MWNSASIRLALAGALWLTAVAGGAWALLVYQNTPDDAGSPPEQWPAASGLARTPGLPMIVMGLHPQCPCSRASLEELARILARAPGGASTQLLFLEDDAFELQSDLWRSAGRIPGGDRIADRGGRLLRVFGLVSSGQALVYGPDGRLLFSGGFTASRGHAGGNRGADAVLAILRGERPTAAGAPVFGCSLRTPSGRS